MISLDIVELWGVDAAKIFLWCVNLLVILFVIFLTLVYNEIAIYISASVKS